MKCRVEIKKQVLEGFQTDGLWGTLRRSAGQHGYYGFWNILNFSFGAAVDYILWTLAMYLPLSPGIRVQVHRARGIKIGRNSTIGLAVNLDSVFPNFISIGNNVSLAGQDCIICHSNPYRHFVPFIESYVAPVVIEDNAWVTVGVIILPGVTVGRGSIVSAGSVVKNDVPPYTIVAGNPAKVVKDLKGDLLPGKKEELGKHDR
jgi:acetyltransferase-like isoleucine patch superfamily enzyme